MPKKIIPSVENEPFAKFETAHPHKKKTATNDGLKKWRMRVAKQKQPLLRLFLSARPLEHFVELGSSRATAKLNAKENNPVR